MSVAECGAEDFPVRALSVARYEDQIEFATRGGPCALRNKRAVPIELNDGAQLELPLADVLSDWSSANQTSRQ